MAFSVRTIQAFGYRYPLSTPVVTSFGRMLDRPAVFVRAEDEGGVVGWVDLRAVRRGVIVADWAAEREVVFVGPAACYHADDGGNRRDAPAGQCEPLHAADDGCQINHR